MKTSRPVIAVPACTRELESTTWHCVQSQYVRAASQVAKVDTFIVPALLDEWDANNILDRVDGLLVSGSRTNVEPSLYRECSNGSVDGPLDPARDQTSITLIRCAIDRGIPLLAICRGIQELNVALGGTLVRDMRRVPGAVDHRAPDGTRDERFAIRHSVVVRSDGCLAKLIGHGSVMVNSLHEQAIKHLAPRLVVEAVASDGTIEAVSVDSARALAIGVQWHPEYWAETDEPSRKLLEGFGNAVRQYRSQKIA